MAGSQFCRAGFILLFYICQVFSNPVNIPLSSVTDSLIQSALNALNTDSPTRHTYKGGNLISAQKLVEQPYIIYRLTFNLHPICKEVIESCPQEACTIDLKQHELGSIEVECNSIQCMYLYPQAVQDDVAILQENVQNTSFQEQAVTEDVEKQIINNQSIELHHEIQVTGDQNDRPFIAVRASATNYCPGCPYNLNPNLPGLVAFTDEVIKSMDELLRNNFKHKLVRIVRVTRSVPISSDIVQYRLLLEIGESDCLKNSLLEQSECSLQNNVPTKLCLVTFEEQPWHHGTRRITKNNCTLFEGVEHQTNMRPNQNSQLHIVAEYNNEQTNRRNLDDAYKNLRDMLLENITNPIIESYTIHPPKNNDEGTVVTERPFTKSQLNESKDEETVIGFTDKSREFNEFLEDFDLPIKTDYRDFNESKPPVNDTIAQPQNVLLGSFTANKEQKAHAHNQNSFPVDREYMKVLQRKKRSYPTVLSDEKNFLHSLAQTALDTLDHIDADNNKRVLLDILDSKKNTSNKEVNYYLTLKVLSTICDEKLTNVDDCAQKMPGNIQICKIHLHTNQNELPHNTHIVSSECHKADKITTRVRRQQLIGAPTSTSVDDPEIIQYTTLARDKFSENSNDTNEPVITEITEASKQVVSGFLYKIKVKFGTSDCPKGVKELINCQLKSESEIKECLLSIWSRPWLDNGTPDIKFNCTSTRTKRSLKGVQYSQKMLAQAEEMEQERTFKKFIHNFNKTYSSLDEEKIRFKVFKNNLKVIRELQQKEQGTGKYGITMFADILPEEFRARFLGLREDLRNENQIPLPIAEIPDIKLPVEFDWRQYGVVTPVKNQGACGSCWAFSVTGNVEGQYAIKHKKLLSLSEQELVDCDKLDEGCNGGLPDNAYRAIEDIGGLETEADYPYEAENEKCHFNAKDVKVKVVSGVNITSNETQMAQWLVKNGPISVGINANAMQFYVGGVSHPFKFLCNPNNLDHGVLIVGYGIHNYPLFKRKLPYWLIKNSWGTGWGEQGYYRVYRGDGTCGVNQMATSAIVV